MMSRGEQHYRIKTIKKSEPNESEDFKESLVSYHEQLDEKTSLSRSRKVDVTQRGKSSRKVISQSLGKVFKLSCTTGSPIQEIEFKNIKWLSIISAYDEKRLKHVTISKKTCESFFNKYGTTVRKDPIGSEEFKDMKKHFRSWVDKINEGYYMVLKKFLCRDDSVESNTAIEDISIALEEIRFDTSMMKEKLQACLKIYDNREFRTLYDRFNSYFKAAEELEEVIEVVIKSRDKINRLFKDLEPSREIDRKVNEIRKNGLSKAKNIVEAHEEIGFGDKIMNKVEQSINQLAKRSIDAFHKIQCARQLLRRIKECITQQYDYNKIENIVTMNRIFKEILLEAEHFEDFAVRFLEQNDMLNNNLRNCISRFNEELLAKKKIVAELQFSFIRHIIIETINSFKEHSIVNRVILLDPETNNIKEKYCMINKLLEDIAESIIDGEYQKVVRKLAQDSMIACGKIEEELEKIRRVFQRNEKGVELDTEEGLIAVLEYCKLVPSYKERIAVQVRKQEEAAKNLGFNVKTREKPSSTLNTDEEIEELRRLNIIAEQLNSHSTKQTIINTKVFTKLPKTISVLELANEAESSIKIIGELSELFIEVQNINENNVIDNLITNIVIKNLFYEECVVLKGFLSYCNAATEHNILELLSKLLEKYTQYIKERETKENVVHQSMEFEVAWERILCNYFQHSLTALQMSWINDATVLEFPEKEYDLSTIKDSQKSFELLLMCLLKDKSKIENCVIVVRIKGLIETMKDYIESFEVVKELNENFDGKYALKTHAVAKVICEMFTTLFIEQNDEMERLKIFHTQLKSFIEHLENKLKNLRTMSNFEPQQRESSIRIRKQILAYENANKNIIKICEELLNHKQANKLLECYSIIVLECSEYLLQRKEVFYAVLNTFKEPVMIGEIDMRGKGFWETMHLSGFKRGIGVEGYVKSPARVVKIETQSKKPERYNQEEMNEEIDEELSVNQKMMNSKEDIIEEFNEEIVAEEVMEVMEEVIEEDQMKEYVSEIVDDIEDEVKVSSKNPKPNNKSPLSESLPKPQILLYDHSLTYYEQFSQITTLEELYNFFQTLFSLEYTFWSTPLNLIDLQLAYNTYNRQSKDKQSVELFAQKWRQALQQHLQRTFRNELIQDIANTKEVQTIMKTIIEISERQWEVLLRILQLIKREYSLLVNHLGILQISIGDPDQPWQPDTCIRTYIESTFVSKRYRADAFDYNNYIQNCFQVTLSKLANCHETRYIVRNAISLPQPETNEQIENLVSTANRFMRKQHCFDMLAFTLNLWLKALSPEIVYQPNVGELTNVKRTLTEMNNVEWFGHYLLDLVKEIAPTLKQVGKVINHIENMVFIVNCNNIVQLVNELRETYNDNERTMTEYYYKDSHDFLVLLSNVQRPNLATANGHPLLGVIVELFITDSIEDGNRNVVNSSILFKVIKDLLRDREMDENIKFIVTLLRVLKTEHYYCKQPIFRITRSPSELIIEIFKQCKILISSIDEINLTDLTQNVLIESKHSPESTELTMNPSLNKRFFTAEHAANLLLELNELKNEHVNLREELRMNIINSPASIGMRILDRKENKEVLTMFKSYLSKIDEMHRKMIDCVNNKEQSPHCFVISTAKIIEEFTEILKQEKSNLKNLVSEWPSAITCSLTELMENIALVSSFISDSLINSQYILISYKLKYRETHFWANLEFLKTTQTLSYEKSSKIFWELLLENIPITDPNFSTMLPKFSSVFPSIKENEITSKTVCIEYNCDSILNNHIAELTISFTTIIEEVYELARQYNINRFNLEARDVEKYKKTHQKLMIILKKQKSVIEYLRAIENSEEFLALIKEFTLLDEFLSALKNQLLSSLITGKNIDECLALSETVVDTDKEMRYYGDWFTRVVGEILKMKFWYVQSSEAKIITCFPMKEVNNQEQSSRELEEMLKEIQVSPQYFINETKGMRIVVLNDENVTWKLDKSSSDRILEDELECFRKDNYGLREGMIYVLVIYQKEKEEQNEMEIKYLYIGEIAKSNGVCNLEINEDHTVVDVHCSVAEINTVDLRNFEKFSQEDSKENFLELSKKIIAMVSNCETVTKVKIGQHITFLETSLWLKTKYNEYLKEKERKRKEQEELEEIKRKEQEERNRKEQELEEQKKRQQESEKRKKIEEEEERRQKEIDELISEDSNEGEEFKQAYINKKLEKEFKQHISMLELNQSEPVPNWKQMLSFSELPRVPSYHVKDEQLSPSKQDHEKANEAVKPLEHPPNLPTEDKRKISQLSYPSQISAHSVFE